MPPITVPISIKEKEFFLVSCGDLRQPGNIVTWPAQNRMETKPTQAFNKEGYSPQKSAVEAVDSTAAGDCFVGTFGAVICEGKSFKAVAEFPGAAVAFSVNREGTQSSLPYREESSLL